MRKSLALISTLTLTAISLGSSASASAIVETPEGETLYTLTDVQAMRDEVNQLIADACGNDMMDCGQNRYYSIVSSDPKYRAMDYFTNNKFLISSVNPSLGQLKLYYNNQDAMNRWYGPMEFHLQSLRMIWSERSIEETTEAFQHVPFYAEAGETPDWYHFVYSSTPGEDDTTIIPGGETEIVSIDPDMSKYPEAAIFEYTSIETNGGLSEGWLSTPGCFDSPYYRDGAECRITFTENYRTKYIPYINGTPAYLVPDIPEDTSSNSDDNSNNENSSDNSENTSNVTPEGDDLDDSENNMNENPDNGEKANSQPKNEPVADTASQNSTSASPTTGTKIIYVATTNSSDGNTKLASGDNNSTNSSTGNETSQASDDLKEEKTKDESASSNNENVGENSIPKTANIEQGCQTEFPWWFIVVLAAIDALIMFLFWPKNRRRSND